MTSGCAPAAVRRRNGPALVRQFRRFERDNGAKLCQPAVPVSPGTVGIEGSPRVQLDGAWCRARGVLIDTDVAHAFDCDGQLTAIGWIEGESRLAGGFATMSWKAGRMPCSMSRCAAASRTG